MTNDEGMRGNDEARMTNDEGMTKSEIMRGSDDSFWSDDGTPFVREEPDAKPVYDLEERTARFGEAVIDFAKTIPQGSVTNRIISQLVGAGTSIGANYVEADDAVSKKEFLKSIGTCRKEARETKHPAHGSARRAGVKSRRTKALDGNQGITPDLFQDLEKRQK